MPFSFFFRFYPWATTKATKKPRNFVTESSEFWMVSQNENWKLSIMLKASVSPKQIISPTPHFRLATIAIVSICWLIHLFSVETNNWLAKVRKGIYDRGTKVIKNAVMGFLNYFGNINAKGTIMCYSGSRDSAGCKTTEAVHV